MLLLDKLSNTFLNLSACPSSNFDKAFSNSVSLLDVAPIFGRLLFYFTFPTTAIAEDLAIFAQKQQNYEISTIKY